MSQPNPCPPRDRWQALLDGRSPAQEQPALAAHLDSCPACQQALEGLAGRDSVLQAARAAGQTAALDPRLEEVLARARGNQSGPAAPPAIDLAFLQPSTRPGALGRLDRYDVLEVVGRGGFGVVLKAFDRKLERVVALKVLAPHLACSGTARQRFAREARAAAAVRDEHVVAIHGVEDGAVPYLVMEYVAGQSLQDRLDRQGALPLREVLRIGMQMAEGLAAAHAQGLVHRDVKPGNVLLENGIERVKLTDFGLARAADDASLTQTGVIAGTPMFMSPEQADGAEVDHRADLFSLGSVLYAMCTGRPPFRAGSTMAVLRRVIDEAPRPIRETHPEVPGWLAAVVEKLHAKAPDDRYQSAAEVAEVLRGYLAQVQQGTAPAEEPVAGPAPPKPRRCCGWLGWAVTLGFWLVMLSFWMWPGCYALVTRGTLIVDAEAAGLRVEITEGGRGVAVVYTGQRQEVHLPPGRYQLRVLDAPWKVRSAAVTTHGILHVRGQSRSADGPVEVDLGRWERTTVVLGVVRVSK